METTPVAPQSQKAQFGPLPSAHPGNRVRNLSKARGRILELLSLGATTVSSLSALTGQHENTIREHLDALVDENLAIKYQTGTPSRGRPAWFYETSDGSNQVRTGEYAGLASALAGSISRTSKHPVKDAIEAGITWSKSLVNDSNLKAKRNQKSKTAKNAIGPRRHVVALFDQLGFSPLPNSDFKRIELTRCPLLEAARENPEIICSVHLGIVRGALAEFGADQNAVKGSVLHPFALQGACLLRM